METLAYNFLTIILTIKLLKIFFQQNLMAIFVHPSGVKKPLHESIDAMVQLHGDKQGKQFHVWVDCVSSAEVASNTWLVKFNKWELTGRVSSKLLT